MKKSFRILIILATVFSIVFPMEVNDREDAKAAEVNSTFAASLQGDNAANGVSLSWQAEPGKFYMIERNRNGGKTEILGAGGKVFDSKKNKIEVFQILPGNGYLQLYNWLKDKSINKGKIDVVGNFKGEYEGSNWGEFQGTYLKNLIPENSPNDVNAQKNKAYWFLKDNHQADGNWKYDVIYVGGVDGNVEGQGGLTEGTRLVLEEFIQSGRGVIFGHDSIAGGDDSFGYQKSYNKLAGYVNVRINDLYTRNPNPNKLDNWSETIEFTKTGYLFNCLHKDIPTTMQIGGSHNVGQVVNSYDNIWARFKDSPRPTEYVEDGGIASNFYLTTYGNCALTMLGHSNDSTGEVKFKDDNEKKLLANLIYYCANVQGVTPYQAAAGATKTIVDTSVDFSDTIAPDVPAFETVSDTDSTVSIKISAADNGAVSTYTLKEYENSNPSNAVRTTQQTVELTSGIKGFYLWLDGDQYTQFVPVSEEGATTISVHKTDAAKNLHVYAADNNDNRDNSKWTTIQIAAKSVENSSSTVVEEDSTKDDSHLIYVEEDGTEHKIKRVFYKAKNSSEYVEIDNYNYGTTPIQFK